MYEKQMSHAANTNKRDDLTTGHMIQIPFGIGGKV
jgi:hypothetical protein